MYSSFYIRPKADKEKRIVRCDPFVQKYNIALFILKVNRLKDMMGGIIVGGEEELIKCWEMIEQNDGKLSEDMEQVMMSISQIAVSNKCSVVYQQQVSNEPSFSSTENASAVLMAITARDELDKVMSLLESSEVIGHVNSTEYYDISEENDKVKFTISKFAAGRCLDSAEQINDITANIENGINIEVFSNEGTQGRLLISSSFLLEKDQANDFVADYKNITTALRIFKSIATARNVFLPRNEARGFNALNKSTNLQDNGMLYSVESDKDLKSISSFIAAAVEAKNVYGVAFLPKGSLPIDTDSVFIVKKSSNQEKDAITYINSALKSIYGTEENGIEENENENENDAGKKTTLDTSKMEYFRFKMTV